MKHIKIGIALLALALLAGCAGEAVPPEQAGGGDISLSQPPPEEPAEIIEADWSSQFDGLTGAAVLYDPEENSYWVYNPALANTRRSPCSTFKIIASLIGLETGTIDPEDSVRAWSGEVFWNEDWNRDLDFESAFRFSCVWYFRQVTDEIGKAAIQQGLDALQYGNCDCSDWEGRSNTNNDNRALTGFWLESSLKISPREQADVMYKLFGGQSDVSPQTLAWLERVMLCLEESRDGLGLYGKTGMGKAEGVVVDAWFTGFADLEGKRVYFCVYLGESPGKDVSSSKAKEIAVSLLSSYSAAV
ncbi:MAG: class D beta-lactamase [Ruminiclostridium sp.]|jgi:beta-lactamase class D|nr:class D beta-lactamase [Ruminiclostridium sp.]